mgnify:FL=1
MFPGGAPFGFYNAPVSKALLIITGATSTLNVLFPLLNIQTFSNSGTLNYLQNSKILIGILRSISYSNGKTLFFGSLLLYNFRKFEHLYGSKRFFDYILASTIIGAGLQYVIMLNRHFRVEDVPAGPFWMIFSLYVPFFLSIPSVNSSNIFGLIPSTGKLLTYIFGLQMLVTSRGAALSGLCGIIAGMVCHYNIFYIKRWLTIPPAISSICSRIFGNLFRSAAPESADGLQGATLEIQRQIRLDELDQQLWNMQQTNVVRRRPVIGNPFSATAGDVPTGSNRSVGVAQQPTTEVSEEQIQQLIEMGFTRYAVVQALAASNNDIATAMNILLSE